MSLTFGSGPFSIGGGTFSFPKPDEVWYCEDWPRRMRAVVAGRVVLDSHRGRMLHRTGRLPAQYFPLTDVRDEYLRGEAPGAWALQVGERRIPGAVREAPDDVAPLAGHVTVDFTAADRWFEEDEPVYAHPRDPYHRVDVLSSSRHVTVRHGDLVVAESHRPKLLFETGLPARHYLPFADVDLALLVKSATVSTCPYKGDGQHWHVRTSDGQVDDAAWSLPHPLPEGMPAREHICFYPGKLEVTVDGERVTG